MRIITSLNGNIFTGDLRRHSAHYDVTVIQVDCWFHSLYELRASVPTVQYMSRRFTFVWYSSQTNPSAYNVLLHVQDFFLTKSHVVLKVKQAKSIYLYLFLWQRRTNISVAWHPKQHLNMIKCISTRLMSIIYQNKRISFPNIDFYLHEYFIPDIQFIQVAIDNNLAIKTNLSSQLNTSIAVS